MIRVRLPGGCLLAGAAFAGWLLVGCGGVSQSTECRRFVGCVGELDAQTGRSTDVVRFQPEGPCWGSSEGAELCTEACHRGVEVLRRQHPSLAACGESP